MPKGTTALPCPMDDALSHPDDDSVPYDAGATWTAACVADLLSRHGVGARHQAAAVAQICAISISQARRKLRGAVWLFNEVLALCRHHGESLDTVFSAEPPATPWRTAPATAPAGHLPATLGLDGLQLPAHVQLGALCTADQPPTNALLATLHDDRWRVGSLTHLRQLGAGGACYRVAHLEVAPADDQPRARIAVLDDDESAAQALSDWFNEVGFQAEAFTDPLALYPRLERGFDAYVLDLMLGGGQTSQPVVERIRREQPAAPIVLLTGQLRDGKASESTLATLLRTQNVTFFEKPVRPAMITAAIQNSLDRQQAAA